MRLALDIIHLRCNRSDGVDSLKYESGLRGRNWAVAEVWAYPCSPQLDEIPPGRAEGVRGAKDGLPEDRDSFSMGRWKDSSQRRLMAARERRRPRGTGVAGDP